ncbi:DUF309 domain-containing protein [Streptomyces laculatispora]|uniref:DUF309 domain-containing protein n=1 Tax=Streptomyces laculatispora TaxID=887464 RepID=UPI001A943326|nr:DUF309 domain-containing protein [Streptomyces laculatispora]MBO0916535.1 DUF309 domain-containing protein [Streptomyces laculatispora]
MDETRRDRDTEGRAHNARPRDGLGRPLPYGSPGVERQPEGVVRSPEETVREAQRLLDAGMPFHAHEVFEDAWKSGPVAERELWRGLAQLAVGLTHAARGNVTGGARLLRRGAAALAEFGEHGGTGASGVPGPPEDAAAGDSPGSSAHGIGVRALIGWARELAGRVEEPGAGPVDATVEAPRLRAGRR